MLLNSPKPTLQFRIWALLILPLAILSPLYAQNDTLHQDNLVMFTDIGAGISNTSQTPFWIRASQNGTIPLQSPLGLVRLGGKALFKNRKNYTQCLIESELVTSIAKTPGLLLPVGNISFQYRRIEVYAGRRKEVFSLCDTVMSSGSYAWSGNSLPIPKVHIGTKGFIPLGPIAFQATFAHGWFGRQQFAYGYFLHQKTIHLRFGKPNQPLKFYAGFVHFAQWGGYAPWLLKFKRTGPNGELQGTFKDYLDVVLVRNSTKSSNIGTYIPENEVGNHVGSIDLALAYQDKNSDWLFYYQHAIESRRILHNLPDGLFGLRWKSLRYSTNSPIQVKHVTIEVLSTLNQNTSFDQKLGLYYNDDYFNHTYQYYDGWNYKQHIIGTPFITLRNETRPEWFNIRGTYDADMVQQINNNRLISYYLGIRGTLGAQSQFKVKLSSSQNYLTFNNQTGKYSYFVPQFSGYMEVTSKLKFAKKTYLSLAIAYDRGQLLPNTFGLYFNLRRFLFKENLFNQSI